MPSLCALAALLLASTAFAAEPRCQFAGQPWIEGRIEGENDAHRLIDMRLGQRMKAFVVVPMIVDGKKLLVSDGGGAGRVPFAAIDDACGAAQVYWRSVEPYMQHVNTPAPNADISCYSNAVIFGRNHGKWIGFDKIEYFEANLAGVESWRWVSDATPNPESGVPAREGDAAKLGVMRLTAEVSFAKGFATPVPYTPRVGRSTPGAEDGAQHAGQISERVFRYTVRSGDDFLGWLSTFYNVPYLFGSSGQGPKSQMERYVGADCADALVAGLRRAGHTSYSYSSVSGLIAKLGPVAGPTVVTGCRGVAGCTPLSSQPPSRGDLRPPHSAKPSEPPLRWGVDVKPGDFLALDYIGAKELPRDWDHIVAAVEDRGPLDDKGNPTAPDGLLGPEDLVMDTGSSEGLKRAPLGDQGHVRVLVLRPR